MSENAREVSLQGRGTLLHDPEDRPHQPTIGRSATMRTNLGSVIRRTMVLSLVLGLFVVAAPRAFADPPSIGESGIAGLVYQRFECDAPSGCFKPARAMVTAVALSSVVETPYRAMTDQHGNFVLLLSPGLYSLSAATESAVPVQSKPMLVRVYPGILVGLRIVIPAH